MPARNTWPRDVEFLCALADAADNTRTGSASPHGVAVNLGWAQRDAEAAFQRLRAGGLVKIPDGTPIRGGILNSTVVLTALGLERAGAWPTPETALDRMVTLLESVEANEHEPEDKRSRARSILKALGGTGRDFGVQLAAAVVATQAV